MAAPGGEPRRPPAPGPEGSWGEGLSTYWHDPSTGIAGFHRIGHLPNEGRAKIWMGLVTPWARYRQCDEFVVFSPGDRTTTTRHVRGLTMTLHEHSARIEYATADCRVDIELLELHEPVDFHSAPSSGAGSSYTTMTGHGHVEAAGTVRGTVSIADREERIQGRGVRAPSWGPRNVSAIRATRWLTGSAGPHVAFYGTKTFMGSGELVLKAFIVRDGIVKPARTFDVVLHTLDDGISFNGGSARFGCADDDQLDVAIQEVTGGMAFRDGGYIGIDNPCEVLVDGRPGHAEVQVSNNTFGGAEMPPRLLHAMVLNGCVATDDA
jgi:hypothetical protein